MGRILLFCLLLGAGYGACSEAREYRLHACCVHDAGSVALLAHFTVRDNTSVVVSNVWVGNVSSCSGAPYRSLFHRHTALNLQHELEAKTSHDTALLQHDTSPALRDFLSAAVLGNVQNNADTPNPCSTAIKLRDIVRSQLNMPQSFNKCTPTRTASGFSVNLTTKHSDTLQASWSAFPHVAGYTTGFQRSKRSSINSSMEDCMALSGFQITPPTGDVVLLLGITGSGKSSFANFIANDLSQLISKEAGIDEYIIDDANGSIGSSTVSHTLVPQLLVDRNYSANIYDCPGFSDTRGTCADVASAYLVRKVVEKAKRVKIIFVVNHSSVQIGNDRKDFPLLMDFATKMIKSVSKFKGSIALVVSKVPRKFKEYKDGSVRPVPDEDIKGNVIKFLTSELAIQSQKGHTKVVDLMNIFLTKKGNDFPNLGLFKKPNSEGPLNDIPLIVQNKHDLQRVLYSNTNYADLESDDLIYSIAEESKLKIIGMVKIINQNMSLAVDSVVKDMKLLFQKKMDSADDIREILNVLQKDIPQVVSIRTDLLKKVKPNDFIRELIKKVKNINPHADVKDLVSFVKDSANWQYFQDVVDEPLQADYRSWLSPFSDLELFLNSSMKWFDALNQLNDRLSDYEVQKNLPKFITDSGLSYKMTDFSAEKAKDFVIKTKYMESYNSFEISELVLDELKVRSMKDVLMATLFGSVQKSCVNGKLTIQGPYIKLSGVASENCPGSNRILNIFASHTVFIDADLYRTGEELQVSLIAPRWYVVGSRKIVLDGAKGKSYEEPAATGKYDGDRGGDGLQGRQGGPGGAFFGVADQFKYGELLSISSNGGEGGDGQNGGTGARGSAGSDAPAPSYWSWSDGIVAGGYRAESVNNMGYYTAQVWGQAGEAGGVGGNGGKGGRGGQPGVIRIIDLKGKSEIKKDANTGRSGNAGQGGPGGPGGRMGRDCCALFHKTENEYFKAYWGVGLARGNYCRFCMPDGGCGTVASEFSEVYASQGDPGKPGASKTSDDSERKVRAFEPDYESFNSFKVFMRESLANGAQRHTSKMFLDALDANPSVNNAYDAVGFVKELTDQEKQCTKIRLHVCNVQFYNSFNLRIAEYAKRQHPSSKLPRTLNVAYFTSLSKIALFRSMHESATIIVDMNDYLNKAVDTIQKFENTRKELSLQHYRYNVTTEYENKLSEKVKTRSDFVENIVKPSLIETVKEVGLTGSQLFQKAREMKQRAETKGAVLVRRKEEIEQSAVALRTATFVSFGADLVRNLLGIAKSILNPVSLVSSLTECKKSVSGLIKATNVEKQPIDEEVLENKLLVTKLNGYEQQIKDLIIPKLNTIFSDLLLSIQARRNSLDFKKWQLQGSLRKLKLILGDLSKEFDISNSVLRSINLLNENIDAMIHIYDEMEQYEDQKSLALYIADMSKESLDTSKSDVKSGVLELKSIAASNLVLERYTSAMFGFKQWSFPFESLYLRRAGIVSSLDTTNLVQVEEITKFAVGNIQRLKSWMNDYQTVIHGTDRYIHKETFTSGSTTSPFFLWSSSEYAEDIGRILNGEIVALLADIRGSPVDKSAIKFNWIELMFRSDNASEQKELDTKLGQYDLVLHHLGTSYYRCGTEVYQISTKSHSVEYSLERGKDGRPKRINVAAEKMREGNMMLSPYAMWTVQLVNVKKAKVQGLNSFKGRVSLELLGNGQYVKTDDCQTLAEDNYAFDDSLSAINQLTVKEIKTRGTTM